MASMDSGRIPCMCEILQRFEDRFFFELSHSLPKFFEWHWKLLAKKNNKEISNSAVFRGSEAILKRLACQ